MCWLNIGGAELTFSFVGIDHWGAGKLVTRNVGPLSEIMRSNLVIWGGACFVFAAKIAAQEQPIVSATWENDTFVESIGLGPYTDRHYTQGARLSYLNWDNEIKECESDFL